MKMKVTQLCPTLCNPMDYTVHGILQARILEWVAFPFSRGSFPTQESNQDLLHCRWILYQLSYLAQLIIEEYLFLSVQRVESAQHWMVRGDWEGCCNQYSLCSLNCPQFSTLCSHHLLSPPVQRPFSFIPSRKQVARVLPEFIWDRHSGFMEWGR